MKTLLIIWLAYGGGGDSHVATMKFTVNGNHAYCVGVAEEVSKILDRDLHPYAISTQCIPEGE